MIICSRTGSRPTEQKSNLENSWPHLRFWVNVQTSIPKRNLEVSYLGWLGIQPVNAVELQIVVNFIELFSFALLLVDFLLSLQMKEQYIHHPVCYVGRYVSLGLGEVLVLRQISGGFYFISACSLWSHLPPRQCGKK